MPIWIPLLLAAASLGANYAGEKKTDKARAAALDEERRMREQRSSEAEAAAKKTADLFTNQGEKEATAAAAREQAYTQATQGPAQQQTLSDILTNAMPTSATTFVADKKAIEDKSRAKLAQRVKAMAALNSFGDVMVGNEIASARNREDIGRAGSALSSWEQNVLPLQLEAANKSGRDWHTLADLLQAASAVTSVGALSTPAAGAGAAAAGGTQAAEAGASYASRQAAYQAALAKQGYGSFFQPIIKGAAY